MENDGALRLDSTVIYGKNPVSWLLEIGTKGSFTPTFETASVIVDGHPTFETTCHVDFKGRAFTVSESAGSKKVSKTRSSVKMLIALGLTMADLHRMTKIPSSKAEWHQRHAQENATVHSGGNEKANSLQQTSQASDPLLKQEPVASSATSDKAVYPLSQGDVDLSINHILQLNEFCAKNGLKLPVFEEIASSGPSHAPIFTMACKLQSFRTEQTRQDSKKRIKAYLAFYMLEKLRGNIDVFEAQAQQVAKDLLDLESNVVEKYADMKKSEFGPSDAACTVKDCAKLFSHDFHELQKKLSGDKVTEFKKLASNDEITPDNAVQLLEQLCAEQCDRGFEMTIKCLYFPKAKTTYIYCFLEVTFLGKKYSEHAVAANEVEGRNMAAKNLLLVLLELSLG